jgi:hypothetical protein
MIDVVLLDICSDRFTLIGECCSMFALPYIHPIRSQSPRSPEQHPIGVERGLSNETALSFIWSDVCCATHEF